MHKPLPRLRPNHEPDAPKRRVENALVKLPRHANALERIRPHHVVIIAIDTTPVAAILSRFDNVLAALVAAAALSVAAYRAHRVRMVVAVDVDVIVRVHVLGAEVADDDARVFVLSRAAVGGCGGIVPGGDFAGDGRRDAGGGAGGVFDGCDARGGGAEDRGEPAVDVGFDVDGIRGCAVVHEGDEDGQRDAEHGGAGAAEVGGRSAGLGEEALALRGEGEHFGQEDDVLAVQLHARGVHLQPVVVPGQAGVEGFHRVHFALLGAFGLQRARGAAERGAFVEGLEALLVEVEEGVVHFARGFFVLEDGVEGEAEGDDFDGHEARKEPRNAMSFSDGGFRRGWWGSYQNAGSQYLFTIANLSLYIAASHMGAPGSLLQSATFLGRRLA